ncbi:MAG: hypothetical protein HQ522_13905 [Bacteroidetes bacterium]|nr:hypothetical protein [Bacteroidota bacterium]
MTPKVNYFERIEDYCLDQLDAAARVEFEAELKLDAKLRSEVKLNMEIQSAIAELDVTNLRDKLKNVACQSITSEPQKDSFELLSDFSDFEELSEGLSSEELINFYDSMPKVHVHQHEMTSNENTHHYYKEQNQSALEDDMDGFEDFDMEGLDGLEEAILEKDIINFRQTLKQVAKSIEPQFTVEEIDSYLNKELSGDELYEFEKELSLNRDLKDELKLHEELEMAIGESEIINLRNKLSQIVETETSWNVSEESIEDFIDGELEGAFLAEFVKELSENSDLIAEVELRRQINDVIGEKDIMELRAGLNAAKEFAEESKVRRLIPETDNQLFKFLRTSVAIMVVLFGIASLLNSGYISSDSAYDNSYESPQWASERSVSADFTYLQRTQAAFINQDWAEVTKLNKNAPEAISTNPVFQFYSGASLQNLEKYSDAITEYSQVINHGDNLFIEEAEWYRSLCYIKIGNKDLAKQELLAVVNRKGYFAQDAKAILRRLKFSLE